MRITHSQLRRMILQEKRRLVKEVNIEDDPYSELSPEAFAEAEHILRNAVTQINDLLGDHYREELEEAVDPVLKLWSAESKGWRLDSKW